MVISGRLHVTVRIEEEAEKVQEPPGRFRDQKTPCLCWQTKPRFFLSVSCSVSRRVRKFSKSDYKLLRVCPPFRPSVCPHGTALLPLDGIWINLISIYEKSVEKIQVSLKSDNNNVYFTRRRFHIYDNMSLYSSYNEKCFEIKVDKIKTHFMFKSALHKIVPCEVMLKNMVQADMPQVTRTYNKAHALCMLDNYGYMCTHSKHVILIAFPRQQWFSNAPWCYVVRRILPVFLLSWRRWKYAGRRRVGLLLIALEDVN
jgi:hypothetical protein